MLTDVRLKGRLQAAFQAPEAESKDHRDQGNLFSESDTEGERNTG